MEIKPGYKRCDIGIIPEDWYSASLRNLATEIGDGIHSTPQYATVGDYFFINGNNLKDGRIIFSDGTKAVTLSEYRKHRKQLDRRTILMSINGTIGNLGLYNGEPVLLGKSAAYLKINDLCHHLFVYFAIQTEGVSKQFQDGLTGTTIKNLGLGTIRQTQIAVPPTFEEQEAVAEALSDADGLIESLEQLLAKKRLIKQGAMQQLLTGKKRLPTFSSDWRIARLSSLAEIRSGGTPSTRTQQFWDGEIPWCTPTDITALNGHKYLTETSRTISAQGLKASSAELIPANSVVMTSRATIGECAINTRPVTTNQGFKNFIPTDAVVTEFLFYLLQIQKQAFVSLCGGSTFLEIGKSQLAAFEVRLPSDVAEQIEIAEILSAMDSGITALEIQISKVRNIKQGMMQQLLTGRIRLK